MSTPLILEPDDEAWDDIWAADGLELVPAFPGSNHTVSVDRELDAMAHIMVVTDVSGLDHVPWTGLVGAQGVETSTIPGLEEETAIVKVEHPVVRRFADRFSRTGWDGNMVWWELWIYRYKK